MHKKCKRSKPPVDRPKDWVAKTRNEAAGKDRNRVLDWIEAHRGHSVQIEVSASCGSEPFVFNGLAIEGIDIADGVKANSPAGASTLTFIERYGEPVADLEIPKNCLESTAEGNPIVLHLLVNGLCIHIWDSNLVEADLERRGLMPVDSPSSPEGSDVRTE